MSGRPVILQSLIEKKNLRHLILKSLELFFHTSWRTILNLGPAWLADVCAAKT